MKAIAFLFTALFAANVAAVESVAVISQPEGQVLVNQGKRFVKAQVDQALLAGDRVMLLQDSSAVLRFKDGCESRLEASVMVVVPETSVCAGGVMQTSRVNGQPNQTTRTGTSRPGVESLGDSWLFVAGAVVVAGSLASGGDSTDDTVSP